MAAADTVRRRDRGSVLMLMPAGVLIVLLLGALAFDLSLVFLRQRQTSSLSVDVANDVATAAIDEDTFRAEGRYRIDPARADSVAAELVATSELGPDVRALEVTVVDDQLVEVVIEVEVDYLFAGAIPGAAQGTRVRARAVADARQDE
jgi:Flp pilus assembly protein TadG